MIELVALRQLLLGTAAAIGAAVADMSADDRASRGDGHDDQFALDVVADRISVDMLLDAGVGVFSEETGAHQPQRPVQVVVDPIDGSTNCARRLAPFGPSLCAYDRNGPMVGVVVNLATGDHYAAIRGRGATKNGEPLVTRSRGLDLIVTGDPCPQLEHPAWTRVAGGSAHDLCSVADGTYDGYFDWHNTESVWDYLAAILILTEAGGQAAEIDGKPLLDLTARANRRIIAASTPHQFELLSALASERDVLRV